jgi:predicted permease
VDIMTIWQDVRDAARQLRRRPGFTMAAVLSLALGIGANTAIFTLIDQVLLRPLPVPHPEQLVLLTWEGGKVGITMFGDTMSYPAYRDIRDRNEVFSGVMCRYPVSLSVGYQGQTARVAGELVSGNYFEVLGVRAAAGRLFTPDDNKVAGGHPLAVLSYDYWVSHFARDNGIVGRTLVVDGVPLTVIGVSEQGFEGVDPGVSPGIRVPIAMKAQMTQGYFSEVLTIENRRVYWVHAFARLKPGVTLAQADAALQPTFHAMLAEEVRGEGFEQVDAETKARFLRASLRVTPGGQGRSDLREGYETPLRVLMAIVALVVLIACANVANLLLERAVGRQREMAVRQALGASAWQMSRRMLVESLMLALVGGVAGLLVALWTSQTLIGFVDVDDAAVTLRATPDLRVLSFTLALCVGAGLLFGLAPALAARRVELTPALKPDGHWGSGVSARWDSRKGGRLEGGLLFFVASALATALLPRSTPRLRQLLVIAQVAISVLLLIGASLFLRTLVNLRRVDLGLRTSQVTTFAINPSLNGYGKPRSRQFYRDLLERVRAMPGVGSAGAAAIGALEGDGWSGDVTLDTAGATRDVSPSAAFNLVSTDYLRTIGIALLAGRDFGAADGASKARVAIVNEAFARAWFGGGNPVGHFVGLGRGPGIKTNIEIVGLMKDSRFGSVREDIKPRLFLDNDQNTDIQQINVYVRSALPPADVHATMRRVVQSLDVNVPVFNVRTLDAQAERTLARERMLATLASAFSLLATVVAAVGVYALMAFTVTARTRELGIRLALGARPRQVLWLVLRDVLAMLTIGTAIALPAAWALSRAVQSQLYGVSPGDPTSLAAGTALLALIAIVAALAPARRASAINPVEALRSE